MDECEQLRRWVGSEPGPMLLLRPPASHGDLGQGSYSQVAATHPGCLCDAPQPVDHTLHNGAFCARGLGAGKRDVAGMAAEHRTRRMEPLDTTAAIGRSRRCTPEGCTARLKHGQHPKQSCFARCTARAVMHMHRAIVSMQMGVSRQVRPRS